MFSWELESVENVDKKSFPTQCAENKFDSNVKGNVTVIRIEMRSIKISRLICKSTQTNPFYTESKWRLKKRREKEKKGGKGVKRKKKRNKNHEAFPAPHSASAWDGNGKILRIFIFSL